jgi:peptide deformylase
VGAPAVADLIATMRQANGAGIAAPQIGEPWRVFVVHGTGDNPRYPYKPAIPLTVFVNPVLEVLDATPMHLIEGCLSVPGFRGRVQRACRVRCRAQRPDGSWFTIKAEGHAAGTLQVSPAAL